MSVIIIDGKPGTGKTLLLTYFSYKDFKRKNPPFKVWFTEKIKRKPYIYTITNYSDYPVRFKKKRKKPYYYYDELGNIHKTNELFSLQGRIFDMTLDHRFQDDCDFYIDEIQQKYDSMEYKDFPDSIAHYWQSHRHLIHNIYTDSQSQSRIIKRVLCLGEEYWSIYSFRIIFGFVIMHIKITFDMHNNLESNNGNLPVDAEDKRIIFRIKKIGNMYDSKYLRHLQANLPYYHTTMYNSLQLDKPTIMHTFFPTDEEKNRIKNLDY